MTLDTPRKHAGGIGGGRRCATAVIVLGLAAMSGCAYTATAAQVPQTTTTTPSSDELFSLPLPRMITGEAPPVSKGEEVVPPYCQPVAAGLARNGSGFLLVVRMSAPVPQLNQPPSLPFGVLLHMIDFNVGIFAPNVSPDLGGSYKYVRQYQTPDRPALVVGELGSGKTDTAATVNVAVRDAEIRIQLPNGGQDTSRVNQWGVSVSCVLRHPVDGFYFPSTRFPAGKAERTTL